MKKISIIIPFWKYKNYLNDCLHSLIESQFKDFEVILVLDHIKEDIQHIIKKYESALEIKVIKLEDRHGVAAARNLGVSVANGEYIYFLDSDDYILEDTLSLLVDKANKEALIYGSISNTWNKRANYLAKIETIDEDDQEEKEALRIERLNAYMSQFNKQDNLDKEEVIYHLIKARKGFSRLSALGNLYRKQFLIDHNLSFNEEFIYYSDIVFICEVLDCIDTCVNAKLSKYVKRKHNDPINMPSLWQIEDDHKFIERMDAYKCAKSKIHNQRMKVILDNKLISYSANGFAKRLRRSQEEKWKKEYYPILCALMNQIDEKSLIDCTHYQKRIVQSMKDKDMSKTLRIIRKKLAIKKMINIFKNKNVFYKLAYYHRYLKKPVSKNVVLFESFFGKNYSDSPKYIYEYLAKHYSDQFEFVWVLNNNTKLPYSGKKVKRFSFRYAYYLATAKYLVFNVRQPLWYRKREEQVFVETWHGTPLKRLVFDQEEVTAASPKYKQQFYKQRVDWDYLVSANHFSTKTFRSCFMYENEMLEFGYPRNDILYSPTLEEDAIKLKKKLGIPQDKKTILYAPTWRDDEHYEKGKYKFSLTLDLKMMQEALSDEYVVLLRTHHYISDAIDTSAYQGFVYNLSKYDDISEIYTISDICITDYSSVFFDYANLRRPILFFTYDLDKYKNLLRGFYINIEEEVPGPLLFTSKEVIDAIKNIKNINEEYKEKYEIFYQRFCHLDDGNASKNIVEKVFIKK